MSDIYRKHGISHTTYYHGKSKWDGLEASELKWVKELGRRKCPCVRKLFTEVSLENPAMRELFAKKAGDSGQKSLCVTAGGVQIRPHRNLFASVDKRKRNAAVSDVINAELK